MEKFQGVTFGIMDGIITALGVMIGLNTASSSKLIVMVGILATGLADAFANAAGIHVSEETEGIHSAKEVWITTITCFFATFMIVSIILIPFLFLKLTTAVLISEVLGVTLLFILGLGVGKLTSVSGFWLGIEYSAIGAVVSLICYFLGEISSKLISG